MKFLPFLLVLSALAITLAIDPRISVLLIFGVIGAVVSEKMGKTAGFVVLIVTAAAVFNLMHG